MDLRHREVRERQIEEELIAYAPKRWKPNLPFRDYQIGAEDLIPALAGFIGKTALVAAFAMAWAVGLGIKDASFVVENVRLELFVGGVFTLLFSAFLNPSACPPGTLALLIPLVPLMASAGVHPLPFAILISVAGFVFARSGFFLEIVRLNGAGTKAGLLLLFGLMGVTDSLRNLRLWADGHPRGMLYVLVLSGILTYLLLLRLRARWFVIPACAGLALVISALYGIYPDFTAGLGLPVLNPARWWNEKWGIGFGLSMENFLTSVPFAVLVMTMWPVDALAIKAMQEAHYPPKTERAYMDINASFLVIVLHNLTSAVLGGAQTAAVWRSFMIPLAIMKRPMAGSALFLGLFGIVFGLFGFMIDLGTFPPLVWLVLLLGVFVPMLETGLTQIKSEEVVQTALTCIIVGLAIHPVMGWSLAMLTENLGVYKKKGKRVVLSRKDKSISLILFVLAVFSYLSMK